MVGFFCNMVCGVIMHVTREMVLTAIKVFTSLESEGSSNKTYEMAKVKRRLEIVEANRIIREYGTQITPMTLDHMQDEYYSLTDIALYGNSAYSASVARTIISSNWNNIGPWVD